MLTKTKPEGIFTPITWNANDFNKLCERIARSSERVSAVYRYNRSDHARLAIVRGVEAIPSECLFGRVILPPDSGKGTAHGGGVSAYDAFTAWVDSVGERIMASYVYIDGCHGCVRVGLVPIPAGNEPDPQLGIG